MKKSKFTEAQIAFILRQAEEGTPVPEVFRQPDTNHGFQPSEFEGLYQGEDARGFAMCGLC
ncbi:MAG TPA: hypothetical protein VIQ29_22255 [Ancylobacter sp.]